MLCSAAAGRRCTGVSGSGGTALAVWQPIYLAFASSIRCAPLLNRVAGDHCENTIEALVALLQREREQGPLPSFPYLEFDVQETADGEVRRLRWCLCSSWLGWRMTGG